MAYTIINKSTANFNTKLYIGNSSTQTISGIGFQPDFVWTKNRDDTWSNTLIDAVRGGTKYLYSDTNEAEATNSTMITSFNSDGYTVGGSGDINRNTERNVSWNWKAGTGQGSSNTAGSINTTYTSVNTTAGFSISKYTGNGVAGATIGHGLGVAPKMIIVKDLENGNSWLVGHDSIGWTKNLHLNETSGAETTTNIWNNTSPTNQVFSVGTNTKGNRNNGSLIAYCFAEKTGYSKFGSYVGNGNADGTFIYTGFKPAFVIIKKTSGSDEWNLNDTTRNPFNPLDKNLLPNTSGAESDYDRFDALSNGFKMKTDSGQYNGSGASYIYMAFGQSIVGTNNVPCTAR